MILDRRIARNASLSLGAFAGLTALFLVAWFARNESPWGLSSFVAFVATIGAAAAGALLWRRPTRQSALGALGILAFSLVRVGLPMDWTWKTIALLLVTAALAVPVAQAAIALPRA